MEGVSICSVTPEMQATLHTFMFQNQIKFASFVRVCKKKKTKTNQFCCRQRCVGRGSPHPPNSIRIMLEVWELTDNLKRNQLP